jgi:hypothetical protein
MRTDNVSDVTFSAHETSPRRRTPLTPPARLVCAIGTYFLDIPHTRRLPSSYLTSWEAEISHKEINAEQVIQF